MAEVPGQLLKPSRRAFLKAIGAMAGAIALPAIIPVKPPVVSEAALPPTLAGLDFAEVFSFSRSSSSLLVYVNGVMQMEGPDFVQTGRGEIRFTDAPPAGSLVDIGSVVPDDIPRSRHLAGGTTVNFELPKKENDGEPHYLAYGECPSIRG